MQQEKNIEKMVKASNDQEKMGNHLQKVLKTDKQNLLMYKSHDYFRMKKEVQDLIEYKINDVRSTPNNNW